MKRRDYLVLGVIFLVFVCWLKWIKRTCSGTVTILSSGQIGEELENDCEGGVNVYIIGMVDRPLVYSANNRGPINEKGKLPEPARLVKLKNPRNPELGYICYLDDFTSDPFKSEEESCESDGEYAMLIEAAKSIRWAGREYGEFRDYSITYRPYLR